MYLLMDRSVYRSISCHIPSYDNAIVSMRKRIIFMITRIMIRMMNVGSYIVPSWIDDPPPAFCTRGTHMHFPFHAHAQDQLPSMSALLAQVEPTILLFLNQLSSLTISNDVLQTNVHYTKHWLDDHTVELESTHASAQRW
jgi:hypothetical protein